LSQDFKDFADYLWNNYRDKKIVEVGIGPNKRVFNILSEKGMNVAATDVEPSKGVYVDDITQPREEIYSGAELIYSIRPPPELHFYLKNIAHKVEADLIIKPMATDPISGGTLVGHKGTRFYLFNKSFPR